VRRRPGRREEEVRIYERDREERPAHVTKRVEIDRVQYVSLFRPLICLPSLTLFFVAFFVDIATSFHNNPRHAFCSVLTFFFLQLR